MSKYDYLVVGAGLYGAAIAYRLKQAGNAVLVIDKRSHVGGNLYCEKVEGINVHKYGAHIFHTSNKEVWDFMNSFVEFNRYTNSPTANYKGKIYNLPFNMNTFYQLWGVRTPDEAKLVIENQRKESGITIPENLEEQAISLVGHDIYEILIKGYTEKQWGRKPSELPAFIIKRLPVRYTFDNNYFDDKYQGIPIGGYNKLFDCFLNGIDTECDTDFFKNRDYFESLADKIVYTGKIDEYYNYKLGKLEYRSLRFESDILDMSNYQGNAVVNYTDIEVPYTRIIEHKHFEFGTQDKTVVTKEYSLEANCDFEPYYPVNDKANERLAQQYRNLSEKEENVLFGGRLAEYKYFNMDQIIYNVLNLNL